MTYVKKVGKKNITIYENNLKRYLNDIRPTLPNSDKERELLEVYYSQNSTAEEKLAARNEIVKMNQRFILSVAKTYANNDESLTMDLVSVGTIGMIEAFDFYDLTKGFKFYTFAQYYIRRAITHFLGNENMLVRPTNNMMITPKIKKIEEEFEKANFRKPTVDEVVNILKEKYDIDLSAKIEIAPVDIIRTDDFGNIHEENDVDMTNIRKEQLFNNATCVSNTYEDQMESENIKSEIQKAMGCLSDIETIVIKMAFGMDEYIKPYKNNEIAEAIDYSAERVRQIKKTALAKLESSMARRFAK